VVEINVGEYVDTYVGRYTLDRVEEDVKKEIEKGNRDVVVNVVGLSINQDYTYLIASMENKYGCYFKGIGNKRDEVDAIVNTGAFIKKDLGVEEYIKLFIKLVELGDYPIMIRDNRLKVGRIVTMNVIQPLMFDDKYFYFNVIRPKYLEPIHLERAVQQDEKIYTRESISLFDIAKYEEGFRFASSEDERYMLDLFESVITGKAWGFEDNA